MTGDIQPVLIVDGPHAGRTYKVPASSRRWMIPNPVSFMAVVGDYEREPLELVSTFNATEYRIDTVHLWLHGEDLPFYIRVGWPIGDVGPQRWNVLRWSGLLWRDAT